MAENEDVKGKRELFLAKLKEKYPDKEYEDEEQLFGQIYDDYDEYDNDINKYREQQKVITDMFSKDPRNAQFFVDMKNGKDPFVLMIQRVGIDGVKDLLEDPDKAEEFSKANADYLARVAKSEELQNQWEENSKASLEMVKAKQDELGLTDEQVDSAWNFIRSIQDDGVIGVVRPEVFDMALKAINYEQDMLNAEEQGEIRGKNYKAEAMLRKPNNGDGVSHLSGANNKPTRGNKNNSIFELADGAR